MRRRPNGEKEFEMSFAACIASNISGKAPVMGAFLHIQIVFRHSIHENSHRRMQIRLDGNFRGFCIRLHRSRQLRREQAPALRHVHIFRNPVGATIGRPPARKQKRAIHESPLQVCKNSIPIGRGRRLDDPFIPKQKSTRYGCFFLMLFRKRRRGYTRRTSPWRRGSGCNARAPRRRRR